jgi:hypothetical protein
VRRQIHRHTRRVRPAFLAVQSYRPVQATLRGRPAQAALAASLCRLVPGSQTDQSALGGLEFPGVLSALWDRFRHEATNLD